jgi:hypothetical protein
MNRVHIRGTVNVRKSFPAKDGKQALVFASIRPSAGHGYIPVKAFGEAAEALGNAHELTVTVEGKLAFDKPKEATDAGGKKIPWPMIVIVEKVVEEAPRGSGAARPEAEEEPF